MPFFHHGKFADRYKAGRVRVEYLRAYADQAQCGVSSERIVMRGS